MANNVAEKSNIKIEEQDWKYVEKINYLGCPIEIPLCDDKTIQQQVQEAWYAWSKVSNLLNSPLLTMQLKQDKYE